MSCCGGNKKNTPQPMFPNTNKQPSKASIMHADRQGLPRPLKVNKVNPEQEKEVQIKKQAVLSNLIRSAIGAPSPFKWFKDGVSGLLRCITDDPDLYDADTIKGHRDICRNCEWATKNDKGELTMMSQCQYPDPENNNTPCSCFLVCLTQTGTCKAKKWPITPLTISAGN